MALWPPGFPDPFAPPPPWWRSPPPPPPRWRPPPSPLPFLRSDSTSSPGGVVAGVVIGIVASVLALAIMCALCQGHRNSRASAAADDDERQVHIRSTTSSASPSAPPWPADGGSGASSTTAGGLPAFTYSPLVKRNVSGGDGEGEAAAAACSVCLGAFQIGETVRLLPACLHLYHAECIDPWLHAHTTCPLCRSDTDPTADAGVGDRLPPV